MYSECNSRQQNAPSGHCAYMTENETLTTSVPHQNNTRPCFTGARGYYLK